MTTQSLRIAPPQEIGPLQVWPLLWESLTPHNYEVSSHLSQLEFAELEEDEDIGIDIGWIQVHNPTNKAILIPSGWVISAGLLQERVLNSAEYIAAQETREIRVCCVERNRWKFDLSPRPVLRAPLSVMTTGFTHNKSQGMWILESSTRQDLVWIRLSVLRIELASAKLIL